jgi:hypothetical protein
MTPIRRHGNFITVFQEASLKRLSQSLVVFGDENHGAHDGVSF